MKMDEIYECKGCGLQLKVVAECKDVGKPVADCGCHDAKEQECHITCCGHDLVKKG
jgi:hypothetical protein